MSLRYGRRLGLAYSALEAPVYNETFLGGGDVETEYSEKHSTIKTCFNAMVLCSSSTANVPGLILNHYHYSLGIRRPMLMGACLQTLFPFYAHAHAAM